jgi:hypothetical protein
MCGSVVVAREFFTWSWMATTLLFTTYKRDNHTWKLLNQRELSGKK